MVKLDKDHITLISEQDMRDICKPLFEHFGFKSLVYNKIYDDGSGIRLTTHAEWMAHYLEKEYFKQSIFESKPSQYKAGHVVWDTIDTHRDILSAASDFNLSHGFTLIRPQDDSSDFYFIGAEPGNYHALKLALDNMPIVNRFLLYFQEKAAELIEKAKESKIVIPNKFDLIEPLETHIERLTQHLDKKQFLSDLNIKHYPLQNGNSLSKREFDVIELMVLGSNAKDIANKLFLSPRTIETHIDNLRTKFNCHTRSELIEQAKDELQEYLI